MAELRRRTAQICILLGLMALWLILPARAQEMTALAQLDPAASRIADAGAGELAIDLAISQPIPYRAFLLNDPPRLVLDFSELDFGPARPGDLDEAGVFDALNWGPMRPGWSRLVATLDGPYRIASAEERVTDAAGAEIRVRLAPDSAESFAARTAKGPPAIARWSLPKPAPVLAPNRRQTGARPLVVVLDPGHGGIDPGAEAGGMDEADVMLRFARGLAEELRRAGMIVVLTRDADVFVPLEARISVARAAKADVFLSLHADALAEGEATGSTIYLMSETASDAASARLAERHDRSDLLVGVDLSGHDDIVASVLMDLARTETGPRARRLAGILKDRIRAAGGRMHRHPVQEAAFSVLKSPDIPSILLEVGFLSSERDRRRLTDPVWRSMMYAAIREALAEWSVSDAAEARLLRQ